MLQQQPLMPPLSDDLSAVEGEDLRLQSYLKECPPNTAASDFGGQSLQGKLRLQDTREITTNANDRFPILYRASKIWVADATGAETPAANSAYQMN